MWLGTLFVAPNGSFLLGWMSRTPNRSLSRKNDTPGYLQVGNLTIGLDWDQDSMVWIFRFTGRNHREWCNTISSDDPIEMAARMVLKMDQKLSFIHPVELKSQGATSSWVDNFNHKKSPACSGLGYETCSLKPHMK